MSRTRYGIAIVVFALAATATLLGIWSSTAQADPANPVGVAALSATIDVGENEADETDEPLDRGLPAAVGSTIQWTVSQKVNALSVDSITRYSSMSFTDVLPEEVEFVSATMTGRNDTDVTTTAGRLAFDPATRTVCYTFDSTWLQSSMPMVGETYTLTITARIVAFPERGRIENRGYVSINSLTMQTNLTETEVVRAALSITKEGEQDIVTPSLSGYAELGFTSVVSQTEEGAAAREVIISDEMTTGLEFLCGSLSIVDAQGTVIEPRIEESPRGFTAIVDRLDRSNPITVDFTCCITPEALGNTVQNTIKASALAVDEVEATSQAVLVYDTVSPRTLTVTKRVKASDLVDDHGDGMFLFVVEGTDVDGSARTYRGIATLNGDSPIAEDGFSFTTCTIEGIAAGEYAIREIAGSRYSLDAIASDEDFMVIEDGSVAAHLIAQLAGSCSFTNAKTSWSGLSDTDCITNHFPGGTR